MFLWIYFTCFADLVRALEKGGVYVMYVCTVYLEPLPKGSKYLGFPSIAASVRACVLHVHLSVIACGRIPGAGGVFRGMEQFHVVRRQFEIVDGGVLLDPGGRHGFW